MQAACALLLYLPFGSSYKLRSTEIKTDALEFNDFVSQFGRRYNNGDQEWNLRQAIFEEHQKAVIAQNENPDRLWNAVINDFADRTHEELLGFKAYRLKVPSTQPRASFLETADVRLRPTREADEDKKESLRILSVAEVDEEEKQEAARVKITESSFTTDQLRMAKASIKLNGQEWETLDPLQQWRAITASSAWLAYKEETNLKLSDLPLAKDWTRLSATTKVRNQNCGNCWAAATALLLEAHHEIYMGHLRNFSLADLTKCTANPYGCGGDGGCAGATPALALHNAMLNGVGEDEDEANCATNPTELYKPNEKQPPYEWNANVHTAGTDAAGRKFGMVGWQLLPRNQYAPVLEMLATRGPATVAVASPWASYGSGIFDACEKDAVIGHSVVLVGYGVDTKIKVKSRDGTTKPAMYWLLQNSWGPGFGESGRIRLLRREVDEEEAYCGFDKAPRDGVTCNGGPSKTYICGMCGVLFDVAFPMFEARNGS
eukprot:TRINITY_DN71615_c0_g1_i1.p1 TRINITY_DN71615_c0_g1~~TRINITY_DN71615_c0_g1_i1.p1  ORF type:complete len:533 (+),score=38.41 TRINITY_DN71615_c0_g1_i1:133-1599(+)